MGRPRKPSTRLELSGAFRTNPGRRRPSEPRPDTPLGNCPARVPDRVKPFWAELVEQAGQWLTGSDRWAVELAAILMAKSTCDDDAINGAELGVLRSLMGALGLTPSDRAKITVPIAKPGNRFAALVEDAKETLPN